MVVYLPAHFAVDNPDWTAAFVASVGAADLVTFDGTALTATLLPILWEQPGEGTDRAELTGTAQPHGRLIGHLALANDQWRTADTSVAALAVVNGPQAYVSPSWYATKREHGRVVPTWNYVSVHFSGRLTFHREPDWLRDAVTRLTTAHEAGRMPAWTPDDAPAAYVAGQLRAIVGVEMHIERVEAKAKLSQNRSPADRAGVVEGLRDDDRSRPAAGVADLMAHRAQHG